MSICWSFQRKHYQFHWFSSLIFLFCTSLIFYFNLINSFLLLAVGFINTFSSVLRWKISDLKYFIFYTGIYSYICLRTDVAASHKDWNGMSTIPFISKHFLIFFVISLPATDYSGVYYLISTYLWVSQISFHCGQRTNIVLSILLYSNLLPCWSSPWNTEKYNSYCQTVYLSLHFCQFASCIVGLCS